MHFTGRLLLMIASLLVLERLWVMGFAFYSGEASANFFQSMVMPLIVIYGTVRVWLGDRPFRWFISAWCLMQGGIILLAIGRVAYGMAGVTPPEQTSTFLDVSAALLSIPLLHAALYVAAGLALLFLPSISAFLRHRATSDNLAVQQRQ